MKLQGLWTKANILACKLQLVFWCTQCL